MRLIPNARKVIAHAWSVRFIGAGLVLQAAAEALPYVMDSIPQGPMRVAAAVVIAAAGVARVVKQEGISDEE